MIKTEPVLWGRLIKLSNSVFFGGRDEVLDLSSEIMRLGLKMVLDLAYTVDLPKARFFLSDPFWLRLHGVVQSKHQPELHCLEIRDIDGCCNNLRTVRVPAPVPKRSNSSKV